MAADRYQFLQGKAFAVDMLISLKSLINERVFLDPVVKRLEDGCANKPPSFVEGVHAVLSVVRANHVSPI